MPHFTWSQLIPGVGHEYAHVATLFLVTILAAAMGLVARASLGTGETAVIPTGKFSLRGMFEFFTEYIGGLAEQIIGHHGRLFAPYFASVFTYILIN